ncbi:sigma-54-dependent transcriptional regulator [Maribellus mangrovi]|uniref:sigma-54-dependent transcriptional regulator n=1 Tax=Maribellus mangrovi TaxID=3133146 RepID=UPI0030EE2A56
MKKILVIDPDTFTCEKIVEKLKSFDFDAQGTNSGKSGLKLIETERFDLIVTTYRIPGTNGLEFLQKIKSIKPLMPVIIITAYAEVRQAVKMIKSGASDYIAKPVHMEELVGAIKRALTPRSGTEDVESFRKNFVTGKCEAIEEVMNYVSVVAPTNVTVLIEGETGTGKEYIAKALHFASERAKKPFVAVDCGAIPKDLANSELFGHIKGAFTGAIKDKDGYFVQANGGTLFLDEVGNLSHSNQVKLLRAIQERYIQKVGDNKKIKVDVRIITASNEALIKQVEANEFREDLYHRLNGFKIILPPLRERGEDLLEFADFFIRRANLAFNKKVKGFDERAKTLINKYSWPGNIRELQNVINRAVLLSKSEFIERESLPEIVRSNTIDHESNDAFEEENPTELKAATVRTEKEVISNALIEANYNKSKAAKLLNIDRKTLYNKIKQYDINIIK